MSYITLRNNDCKISFQDKFYSDKTMEVIIEDDYVTPPTVIYLTSDQVKELIIHLSDALKTLNL